MSQRVEKSQMLFACNKARMISLTVESMTLTVEYSFVINPNI